MIRVMLVDDHAVVRMGFRMLLNTADIEVISEAESGEDACQTYAQALPDVVIMDLSMPGMGGLEALRRLLAKHASARILVLSAHEVTAYPQRALKAGALGYLSKRGAPDALIDAISLCGPAERIKDRLAAWKDVSKAGHVGTMVLKGTSVDVLRVVAEAVL